VTVTFIGSTQGDIPPVPVDAAGDHYEIDLPLGWAVGDLVILHWGLTKSALDAFPARMRFSAEAELDTLEVTVAADSSDTVSISGPGGEASPRLYGVVFGVITADTPAIVPLQVTGPSPDPLHGTDRFGITVWRGVTQAFLKSAEDFGGFAGEVPAHTAPHSVTWFSQAGFLGAVTTGGGPNGWEWSVPLPASLDFELFDETVNANRGVGVSEVWHTGDDTLDAGYTPGFGGTEALDGDTAWAAFTIGLSDVAPEAEPDPEPEVTSESFPAPNSLSFSSFASGTIESLATPPPPSGGLDVPLYPYRVTKDPT
jgi:hypothetical protein